MRTVRPRHAAAWIVVAVLFSVLTGCGGAPAPEPLPKPSGSTSPSASASATPGAPVMPGAARAKTKAGAEAAVRHFLIAMGYAGNTGETGVFESTYTMECARCRAITDGIKSTYANGGSIVGGDWRPTRLKFYAIEGDIAYIDAVVDYVAQIWIKSTNARKTMSPARRNVLKTFQLIWREGKWRVGALDPQP
jgi:hypothetical protein